MTPVQQFRYLNVAGEWPLFEGQGMSIHPNGHLTLAVVPGRFKRLGSVEESPVGPIAPAGISGDERR